MRGVHRRLQARIELKLVSQLVLYSLKLNALHLKHHVQCSVLKKSGQLADMRHYTRITLDVAVLEDNTPKVCRSAGLPGALNSRCEAPDASMYAA